MKHTTQKQVDAILNGVIDWDPSNGGMRLHDDHDGTYDGTAWVTIGDDGDALLQVVQQEGGNGLRFRTHLGGGMSPRTHNALVILARAIKLDNADRPQPKRRKACPSCEGAGYKHEAVGDGLVRVECQVCASSGSVPA